MGVSRTSRARVTELRNPVYSGGVNTINRISKVSGSSEVGDTFVNYEFSKESFYDSLADHRGKKTDFEKEKEKNKKGEQSYNFTKQELEMIEFLKNAFNNFNGRIDQIKNLDRLRGGGRLIEFKKSISNDVRFLSSIGIYTDKFDHFNIRDEDFARNIRKLPGKLPMLTDPQTGILRKITDALGKVSR